MTVDTSILKLAESIIAERQNDYDSPDKNFQRIAELWSVILEKPVTAQQVALCMITVKITRLMHEYKRDSLVDIIGYALCYEMVENEKNKNDK